MEILVCSIIRSNIINSGTHLHLFDKEFLLVYCGKSNCIQFLIQFKCF